MVGFRSPFSQRLAVTSLTPSRSVNSRCVMCLVLSRFSILFLIASFICRFLYNIVYHLSICYHCLLNIYNSKVRWFTS